MRTGLGRSHRLRRPSSAIDAPALREGPNFRYIILGDAYGRGDEEGG